MKESIIFPFGWLRGVENDNWQLLWNPETGIFFAKGATSKKIINIGKTSNWMEAKALAERIYSDPKSYGELIVAR